ncbi:VWA domain-containing protein [bacterium]|nr:VWA domain-containing protein [bacterium]
MLRFANTYAVVLWLGVPVLILLFWFADAIRRRALEKIGDSALIRRAILQFIPSRRRWKRVFLLLGYSFFVLAAMRPQVGTKLEKVKREGIDIVFALDVSKSMLAEDLKPNRLANAKSEIRAFINHQTSDRVGLVVFAGDAFLACPLTIDYDAFLMFLESVDITSVDAPGTDIARAIDICKQAFTDDKPRYKAIILITDGEQTAPGDPISSAIDAQKSGIRIFTIGVGTPTGAPIPVKDASGNIVGYKKDENGAIVTSHLDGATLTEIAERTGGKYFPARPGSEELRKILAEIDKMGKREMESITFSHYDERFYYPLGAAIIFLFLFWIFPERKRK